MSDDVIEIPDSQRDINGNTKANIDGTSPNNEGESDTGAIIGLSLGGIAFFLTITIIVIYCSRKNLAKTEQSSDRQGLMDGGQPGNTAIQGDNEYD